jgi:hypothetical protein
LGVALRILLSARLWFIVQVWLRDRFGVWFKVLFKVWFNLRIQFKAGFMFKVDCNDIFILWLQSSVEFSLGDGVRVTFACDV